MNNLKEGFLYKYKSLREAPYIKGPVGFFTNSIVQFLLLTITPFYFAWLDIFADDSIKAIHYKVFLFLIFLLSLVQLVNLFEKKLKIITESNEGDTLKKAIRGFARIVNQKIHRFNDECKVFVSGEDPFDKITRPDLQIQLILQQAKDIIINCFDIPEEQIDVNICGNPSWLNSGEWDWFMATPDKPGRTPAPFLMNNVNSTARQALSAEAAIFYPDKSQLNSGEHYHKSPRDDSLPSGSIYCCPISVKHVGGTDRYVFSVNTYGRKICHHDNQDAIDFFLFLFSEYKRRILLELILLTLRKVRHNS